MRLAHLKCPNCDGFVEFTESQELFCKNCGSELMIKLDPEDYELQELQAMPEILNDKYLYEKKLYESELRQDEEKNKQRLVQEWRQKGVADAPKKRKALKIYIIILIVGFITLIMGSIIFSVIGEVASSFKSSSLSNRNNNVNYSSLIELEAPTDDKPIEDFKQFRRASVNNIDDVLYCMEKYLSEVDGDQFYWEEFEFRNAYLDTSNTGTTTLYGVFDAKCGDYTVCRVVALNNVLINTSTWTVTTDMDFHMDYNNKIGDMRGAYTRFEDYESQIVIPAGDKFIAYN